MGLRMLYRIETACHAGGLTLDWPAKPSCTTLGSSCLASRSYRRTSSREKSFLSSNFFLPISHGYLRVLEGQTQAPLVLGTSYP